MISSNHRSAEVNFGEGTRLPHAGGGGKLKVDAGVVGGSTQINMLQFGLLNGKFATIRFSVGGEEWTGGNTTLKHSSPFCCLSTECVY